MNKIIINYHILNCHILYEESKKANALVFRWYEPFSNFIFLMIVIYRHSVHMYLLYQNLIFVNNYTLYYNIRNFDVTDRNSLIMWWASFKISLWISEIYESPYQWKEFPKFEVFNWNKHLCAVCFIISNGNVTEVFNATSDLLVH